MKVLVGLRQDSAEGGEAQIARQGCPSPSSASTSHLIRLRPIRQYCEDFKDG
jgi:hypothetical protein